MKAQLAWVLASQISELKHQVEAIIRQYSKAMIRSPTAYPCVVQAVHALCS
jgi:hypothetical protein